MYLAESLLYFCITKKEHRFVVFSRSIMHFRSFGYFNLQKFLHDNRADTFLRKTRLSENFPLFWVQTT